MSNSELTPNEILEARQRENAGQTTHRKPQDRKAKQSTPRPYGNTPIEIEYDGYTYEIFPSALDSWSLVEAMARGEEPDIIEQLTNILGEEGYDNLVENTIDTHGYDSAQVIGGIIQVATEAVQSLGK